MASLSRILFAGAVVSAVSSSSSYTDDNIMYDISWVDKKDMPLAVSDATASVVNGLVYIIGGCDSKYGNSNVGNATDPNHVCVDIADHVLIYDPSKNSWATSNNKMNVERYRHAAVVVGTDIYVVGGRDVADQIVRSVLKYSTVTDAWTMISEFAGATSDNAAFEHDGKVITCGGYPLDYSAASTECNILNPADAKPKFELWKTKLAGGRGDFSIVKSGGKVYAYGGFSAYENTWTALATIEWIDPAVPEASSTWVTLPERMMHGRGDFAAAVVHGRLLAIGGENSSSSVDAGASLRHVEAYNPKTHKWLGVNQLTSIPHATFRFCAASVDEAVFIFGGQGPHETNCDCYPAKKGVFVYNENLTKQTSMTQTPTDTPTDGVQSQRLVLAVLLSFLTFVFV